MKYPIVQQHSEEDCGAACLATVFLHYGRRFSISCIREAVGTGELEATFNNHQGFVAQIRLNILSKPYEVSNSPLVKYS